MSRAAIVAEARLWIGTPYLHQASAIGVGCDCLGVVRGVWRGLAGIEPEPMPAYSPDWAEGTRYEMMLAALRRHMVEIAPARARDGDVLVFRWRPWLPAKHAAILTNSSGSGRIVHAYDAAHFVVESPLAGAWRRRLAAAFSYPFIEA